MITPADVNQPLYYLHNFTSALNWVVQHSSDILAAEEQQQINDFQSLTDDARALLLRMVMRKGEQFLPGSFHYAEIVDIDAAMTALSDAGFIEQQPDVSLDELYPLLRKDDILQLLQHQQQYRSDLTPALQTVKKSLKKEALWQLALMLSTDSEGNEQRMTYQQWTGQNTAHISLRCMPLFDTIRLLFFGNYWQDWSEFVLTELGHQRYEPVPLTESSRAFPLRNDLLFFQRLGELQQQHSQCIDDWKNRQLSAEQCAAALLAVSQQATAAEPPSIAWLEQRRQRFLADIGRDLERTGALDTALSVYALSSHREAQVRALRVSELLALSSSDYQDVAERAHQLLNNIQHPESRITLERIYQRMARKCGIKVAAKRRAIKEYPSRYLSLSDNADAVEYQVMDALNQQNSGQYWYVENTLLPALFALLFWPAIYKPVAGAFFHPFQSGPADLFRDDFSTARTAEIEDAFRAIEEGRYQQIIHNRYDEKYGISCPLIHWPTLTKELLQQALVNIPAAHLQAVFHHLLSDLRHHSRGLPDLVWFTDGQTQPPGWSLIEVKGPGDRLQDHQRLWLDFFLQHDIDASVCYVSYD